VVKKVQGSRKSPMGRQRFIEVGAKVQVGKVSRKQGARSTSGRTVWLEDKGKGLGDGNRAEGATGRI
jgi:hypothetical protein